MRALNTKAESGNGNNNYYFLNLNLYIYIYIDIHISNISNICIYANNILHILYPYMYVYIIFIYIERVIDRNINFNCVV